MMSREGTHRDGGGVSPAHALPTIPPLSSIQALELMMYLAWRDLLGLTATISLILQPGSPRITFSVKDIYPPRACH